ncbi:MAG TPA: VOC family protein [Candidatus Woesebacteria bacterium]|nr:VOC family protein [Candidatus Woesebacteria bacterium]
MFKKLYAFCLLVEDYETSLSFYKDTLGLELNSSDTKYADFKLGETLLAIFQKDEAISMFPTKYMNSGGGSVIAFPVENVEEACEELKQKGIKIFEGPKQVPWGQTVAYFKDPDNNILEITNN